MQTSAVVTLWLWKYEAACLPVVIYCVLEENITTRTLEAEAKNVGERVVEEKVGF